MTARQAPRQRPFRFGVLALGLSTLSARAWLDQARRVEGEGWSSLVVGDHFLTPLSCTARLAAAAAVTTTLRLGSYVYCNDFRHPALLAKEAAELDQLSDGRFELGMGAGWLKVEYDMIGLPFDEGRVRADRFQEAVRVVKRLLAGETLTHEGEHYRFAEYEPASAPVQDPVPLLLGGGGPRMTRFASRHADIIAFDPMSTPDGDKASREFAREALDDKVRILDEVSSARVDGGPERGILLFHVVRDLDELGPDAWVDAEIAARSPYVLAGPPSAMIDLLQERRERWGLTYVVCSDQDIEALRPVVAALAGG
jgi:probable F420-dependent oxidoreductase